MTIFIWAVFLKDVHCLDLEALLDFMYRGVVHIQKTALASLLRTAEGLQIRGLGLFSQEGHQHMEQNITPTQPTEERLSLTGIEPSVFLSPDRKRAYDSINTTVSSDQDASTSLGNFSETDLDDHTMSTNVSSHGPVSSQQPPQKKNTHRLMEHPPSSVPDLPKVGDDQVRNFFDFSRYIWYLLRYL